VNPIVVTLAWAKRRHLQHRRCYCSLSQKSNHKKSATILVAKMTEDNLKKKRKRTEEKQKEISTTTLIAKMTEYNFLKKMKKNKVVTSSRRT